jgi:hypothetical protein
MFSSAISAMILEGVLAKKIENTLASLITVVP